MRPLVLFLAFVLALPAAYVAESSLVSVAWADDDDDGGGGGGRGPRESGGSGGNSARDFILQQMKRPVRRARRVRAAPPPPVVNPNELIVSSVTGEELDLIEQDGFQIMARAENALLGGEVARLQMPAGINLDTARERVRLIAPASVLDENHLYRPVEMPCRTGNCPAFEMVGWAVPPQSCSLAPVIGMIDTDVNEEHEAFYGQSLEVVSVLAEDERKSSAVHGTAVAALLVGSEASRTPGLLPKAHLVAVEAFHRDQAGDASDAYKIVLGIDALVRRDVGIVNMSFGGPPNAVLAGSISAAAARGMVVVAAAGNRGPKGDPVYPGAYPDVIAVTAVDRSQRVYRQAGQGDHIDFAAPGVRLWTAASISGGRFRTGTSYAVPFVTAAVSASIAGAGAAPQTVAHRPDGEEPAQGPEAVIEQLSEAAVDVGEPGRDPVFGWGIVHAPACGPA